MPPSDKHTPSHNNNSIRDARFQLPQNPDMEQFNASISFDHRLYPFDIQASKAHVRMLASQNIIPKSDAVNIENALNTILTEFQNNQIPLQNSLEDVHMHVEHRLTQLLGPDVAGKLHTARSRNDQVATDAKLFTRNHLQSFLPLINNLQLALAQKALKYADAIMPGYTHLQPAQPISFGHHCLAYVHMLQRDKIRFQNTLQLLDASPLGAGALAGTPFPINPHQTAKELLFSQPADNSLDAVSDRDFAIDAAANVATTSMHLSRLAEDVVLWASQAFQFVKLPDQYSTGSSIMPQKRNPDAAELIRAKAAKTIGNLVALLALMKALPLAYSKDMQDDKPPLFDSLDTLALSLPVAAGLVSSLIINTENMKNAALKGGLGATSLADHLVKTHNIPFRKAHQIVARAAQLAEQQNTEIHLLSANDLLSVDPLLNEDARKTLDPLYALNNLASHGSSNPAFVKQNARSWLDALQASSLSSYSPRPLSLAAPKRPPRDRKTPARYRITLLTPSSGAPLLSPLTPLIPLTPLSKIPS